MSLQLPQPELLARLTEPGFGLLSVAEWVLNAIGGVGYLGSQQSSLYYMCGFCLYEHIFSVFLSIFLRVGFLGHMVALCLTFKRPLPF